MVQVRELKLISFFSFSFKKKSSVNNHNQADRGVAATAPQAQAESICGPWTDVPHQRSNRYDFVHLQLHRHRLCTISALPVLLLVLSHTALPPLENRSPCFCPVRAKNSKKKFFFFLLLY